MIGNRQMLLESACVYTSLIGQYEDLNEQPIALRSQLPFICFTDDPSLKSDTWQIQLVTPAFSTDPARSQRMIKFGPHEHLPTFRFSLYIDNSVVLTEPPEKVIERHLGPAGISLAPHSYRDTVLDEFLEVMRLGYDDRQRIGEQLRHYIAEHPNVLLEKPYAGGIQVRDHQNPRVQAVLETWAAQVCRYSRRDQLSANMAFRLAGYRPDIMQIDIRGSWFHSWPHVTGRKRQ